MALCPHITHIAAWTLPLKPSSTVSISIGLALDISNEYPGINLEPPAAAFSWSWLVLRYWFYVGTPASSTWLCTQQMGSVDVYWCVLCRCRAETLIPLLYSAHWDGLTFFTHCKWQSLWGWARAQWRGSLLSIWLTQLLSPASQRINPKDRHKSMPWAHWVWPRNKQCSPKLKKVKGKVLLALLMQTHSPL